MTVPQETAPSGASSDTASTRPSAADAGLSTDEEHACNLTERAGSPLLVLPPGFSGLLSGWRAVPGLAGRAVPRGRAPAAVARALRHPVPDRGEQQQLLPAAIAGDVRRLAGADPGRLRHGGQGQPVSNPRTPAARPGRASGPAARRGRGAGNQARAGPAPAAA